MKIIRSDNVNDTNIERQIYFLIIDRKSKITYIDYSDRSVETCEAYRRGRVYDALPLFLYINNKSHTIHIYLSKKLSYLIQIKRP